MTCLRLPHWGKTACGIDREGITTLIGLTCPTCRRLARKPQLANQIANAGRGVVDPPGPDAGQCAGSRTPEGPVIVPPSTSPTGEVIANPERLTVTCAGSSTDPNNPWRETGYQ